MEEFICYKSVCPAFKETEINYFYKVTGTKKSVAELDLRVSEEGLVRMFGFGPWIWQQFVLLKLERSLRIQEGHENDFETFDSVEFALHEWQNWLDNPSNKGFRKHFYNRLISEDGRLELRKHIMMPFKIIEKIANNAPGWDVKESQEFGIFTYSNHFGTGMFIPLIVCLIQWMIPILLVINSVQNGQEVGELSSVTAVSKYIFCVSDEEASKEEKLLTTVMVLCIQLLYTTKVVVDRLVSFLTSLGVDAGLGTYNVYYRLNALRNCVRESRKESIGQSIGYTLGKCLFQFLSLLSFLQ